MHPQIFFLLSAIHHVHHCNKWFPNFEMKNAQSNISKSYKNDLVLYAYLKTIVKKINDVLVPGHRELSQLPVSTLLDTRYQNLEVPRVSETTTCCDTCFWLYNNGI